MAQLLPRRKNRTRTAPSPRSGTTQAAGETVPQPHWEPSEDPEEEEDGGGVPGDGAGGGGAGAGGGGAGGGVPLLE